MGEALLARANAYGNSEGGTTGVGATIEVEVSNANVTVTCSNGTNTYTQTGTNIRFVISTFGTWTLKATYSSSGIVRTKSVVVDTYKLYSIKLMDGYTYGISINMSTSSPNDAVTYTDDAVGFTPLAVSSGTCNYGSWQSIITDTFGVAPCLYNNSRGSYLNPNNYAVTTSGASADITSGSSGDVMVEFKKTWYKFGLSGNVLTFQVSDYDRSDDGFCTEAFKSMDGNETVKDYMYYSAYEGYNSSSKLRSLSGKTPTRNITIGNFRTYCKAIGSTYGLEDWGKRTYILGLLMLVTKARGIQSVIGNGICDSNSAINTGTMNTKGLFYGGASSVGCKVFGIENFWGNYYKWCDGLVTTGSSGTIKIKTCAPYCDGGDSTYTTVSGVMAHGSNGCVTGMIPLCDGKTIFPSMIQSDYTIGWQDYANVNSNASYVANVGGNYNNNADNTGPFYVNVNNSASNTNTNIGARCVASNPYSGQHFITMSKIFEMLRSFTGSITSSMSIINISMKSCEYRSQRTRLILAKDIGKMLLAKERVSNLYKVLVESPLEPNRGYTINSNNLNLSGFGNMQIL